MLNDILTGKASLETTQPQPMAAPRPQVVYEPVYVQPREDSDLRWIVYILCVIGMAVLRYAIRTSM